MLRNHTSAGILRRLLATSVVRPRGLWRARSRDICWRRAFMTATQSLVRASTLRVVVYGKHTMSSEWAHTLLLPMFDLWLYVLGYVFVVLPL